MDQNMVHVLIAKGGPMDALHSTDYTTRVGLGAAGELYLVKSAK